jgi:hypothetical protein
LSAPNTADRGSFKLDPKQQARIEGLGDTLASFLVKVNA